MLQQSQMTPNQQSNTNQANSMQQQPPTPNSQNQSQSTPQAVTPQLTPNQQNQMIATPQNSSIPTQVLIVKQKRIFSSQTETVYPMLINRLIFPEPFTESRPFEQYVKRPNPSEYATATESTSNE